jgi:hypothetical protein
MTTVSTQRLHVCTDNDSLKIVVELIMLSSTIISTLSYVQRHGSMDMYDPDQMSCGRESYETVILTGREDGLQTPSGLPLN